MTRAAFVRDLFQFGVYKRNQGRIVRQVTFAAIAIALLLGAWQLFEVLRVSTSTGWVAFAVPGAISLIGTWFAYRLVNFPQFADFLIAVEAEMNKVSWPSRTELVRSSLVVIFLMFFLAFILFGFDLTWQVLFKAIGVIQTPGSGAAAN